MGTSELGCSSGGVPAKGEGAKIHKREFLSVSNKKNQGKLI